MVEEAGQVLEAHILTSLVSSGELYISGHLVVCLIIFPCTLVHHLICIGDPQQLRPTLATFGKSDLKRTSLSDLILV